MIRRAGRRARGFVEAGESEGDRKLRTVSIVLLLPIAIASSLIASIAESEDLASFALANCKNIGAVALLCAIFYSAHRVATELKVGWDEARAPKGD